MITPGRKGHCYITLDVSLSVSFSLCCIVICCLSWFRKKLANVEPGVGKWVSYLNREKKLDSVVGCRPSAPPAPKGLYLYGNVGSGMLLCLSYTMVINMQKRDCVFHVLYLLVTYLHVCCIMSGKHFLLIIMPYFICFLASITV